MNKEVELIAEPNPEEINRFYTSTTSSFSVTAPCPICQGSSQARGTAIFYQANPQAQLLGYENFTKLFTGPATRCQDCTKHRSSIK